MSTIVALKQVKKSFSHQPVLRDVSFTIEEGAFVAITGASGCGKSTLLNLIGLLDRPDAGELTLFGRSNISPFSVRAQRLLKMMNEQGKTIILVTHDKTLADRCDRCLYMTEGKVSRQAIV